MQYRQDHEQGTLALYDSALCAATSANVAKVTLRRFVYFAQRTAFKLEFRKRLNKVTTDERGSTHERYDGIWGQRGI